MHAEKLREAQRRAHNIKHGIPYSRMGDKIYIREEQVRETGRDEKRRTNADGTAGKERREKKQKEDTGRWGRTRHATTN